MENSNDTTGNQTHDLLAHIKVSQPNAPMHARLRAWTSKNMLKCASQSHASTIPTRAQFSYNIHFLYIQQ
jgi:cellobiose phosphorylase